jgi:hypothetical protein
MTAFWDIVPSSLVKLDRHFRGVYRVITLMMEAVHAPETLLYFNKTTWLYNPKAAIFILATMRT